MNKKIYWNIRIFAALYLGYIAFHLNRGTFPILGQFMLAEDYFLSKYQYGILLSLANLVYGVSKFSSGILVDKTDPRYVMTIGLFATGVINLLMPGVKSNFILISLLWTLNSMFQGFGWPSVAKMLINWYERKKIGIWWVLWSTSHNTGEGLVSLLIAVTSLFYFSRTTNLYIVGFIGIIFSIFLFKLVRSSPKDVGLEETSTNCSKEKSLFSSVLNNIYIWFILLSAIFVYFIKSAMSPWAIDILRQRNHGDVASATVMIFFHAGGFFGTILSGIISDKLFRSRRSSVILLYLLGVAISIILLRDFSYNIYLAYLIMFLLGFFLAGPLTLIGLLAAETAGKQSASTATGFIGLGSYLSSSASHFIIPIFINRYFFYVFLASIVSSIFLLPLLYFEYSCKKIDKSNYKN